jgi:hypothetical protein
LIINLIIMIMRRIASMESGRIGRQTALLAAIRRYPDCELAIRRLIETEEPFRDICEELAEAERALSKVADLPVLSREARRVEWQEIVDRLAGEMKAVLKRHDAFLWSRVSRQQPG